MIGRVLHRAARNQLKVSARPSVCGLPRAVQAAYRPLCTAVRAVGASIHVSTSSVASLGRSSSLLTSPVRRFSAATDHIKLTMPALSPTMTQGNIAKWVKKEGDKVEPGNVLAEVETDKATVAFESVESGYLAKILVAEGSKDVPVNKVVAILVDSKEDVAKFANFSLDAAPAAPAAPAAAAPKTAAAPAAPASSGKKYPEHIKLAMPALSPTMTQGNIARWVKKVGDKVDVGASIAEVETDKATVSFDSVEAGFIAKILVPEGSKDVPVGKLVAILVDEQKDVAAFSDYTGAEGPAPAAAAAAAPAQQAAPQASASSAAPTQQAAGGRVFATPLARTLAAEKGFPLNQIHGTGPNNRILAADVREFTPSAAPAAQQVAAPAAASAPQPVAAKAPSAAPKAPVGDYKDIPHTQIRRIIAKRLSESKHTIPHYYLTVECAVDEILKLRAQLNAGLDEKSKISVNDFIIKASALALRKVPTVNASWLDDAIRQYNYVDISVAVATPTGLITPIVKDADLKGLSTISGEVKSLAARAKENKLTPDEFQGGTFTISNLGMFGVKNFSAIINPPQSAILAIGSAESRLVPNEGKNAAEQPYKTTKVMSVTMSCDHRVVDGALGAQWLQAFKGFIENPVSMLL